MTCLDHTSDLQITQVSKNVFLFSKEKVVLVRVRALTQAEISEPKIYVEHKMSKVCIFHVDFIHKSLANLLLELCISLISGQ